MIGLREQLGQRIQEGKLAISNEDYSLAIFSFQKAIKLASDQSPVLNNIIGVSYAYLALSFFYKGDEMQARTNIDKIEPFFDHKPFNTQGYAAILLSIGLDFQRLKAYEFSIIPMKVALKLTRESSLTEDLEAISIISRNLAYSYYKMQKQTAAAKLFRIAGDLEENPKIAIELYQNSSYLYYQENMKEEALNILETAFNKVDIAENSGLINYPLKLKKEIAHFQAIIAYEIYQHYISYNDLNQSLDYINLSQSKFSFIDKEFWPTKTLYEEAMIYNKLDKINKRDKLLEKVVEHKYTEDTNIFIIRAGLLLLISSLEKNNFPKVGYYLQILSNIEMEYLNPSIANIISQIREISRKSLKRGQIQTNLRFTLKDLDLPVEKLIEQYESLFEERSLTFTQFKEKSQKEIDHSIGLTGKMSQFSGKLKPPSLERLQELFEVKETTIEPKMEEREAIPETIPTTQEEYEEGRISPSAETLSNLFREHRILQEEDNISEINITTAEDTENKEIQERISLENIPTQAGRYFQRAGWTVRFNLTTGQRRGAEPDIIAEKGLIRRRKKLIFFAENPTDAEICGFLLQSSLEEGEKLVFLMSGDPRTVKLSRKVKLITHIDQLF
ncbi:hypothetical protein [Candidatus Hodarchaeum mangrovi]